jgi:isopentenyl phosphate kinase
MKMHKFIHCKKLINLHFILKPIFTVHLLIFVLYGDVVSTLDKVVSNDEIVNAMEVILDVVVVAYF